MHNLKIFVTLNKIFWKAGGEGGCWWLYFKNLCSSYSIPLYSWLAVLWRVIYGDFHCPTLYKWTFSGSESILFQHIDPICSHSWWMISVCKEEGCFWDEMIKNPEVIPHWVYHYSMMNYCVYWVASLFIEWPTLCAPFSDLSQWWLLYLYIGDWSEMVHRL